MSATAPPTIAALPTPPTTADAASFDSRADGFLAALPAMTTQINEVADNVYANALEAFASAALAAVSANFKGDWSSLTGALNVPATVRHASQYWVLLSNLANVTTATPGVSGAWAVADAAFGSLSALTSINGGPVGQLRSLLVNGCAQVAQRTNTINLSTSKQIGQVDNISIHASVGAVSAGTLTQNTAAICGSTGYAARAAGVTLTGSAVLSATMRMESVDAKKYKNKTVSLQVAVAHDVGSSVNYTVILKKPTAADNWASTTTIATSSATAVATATGTVVKFENQSIGDCSNGIEIEVQAACGAVTTKNFDFTDFAIDIGAVAPTVMALPYDIDLHRCQRYLPAFNGVGSHGTGTAYLTTNATVHVGFKVPTRVAVTGTVSANTALFNLFDGTTNTALLGAGMSFVAGGKDGALLNCGTAAALTQWRPYMLYGNSTSAQLLFTGAELV